MRFLLLYIFLVLPAAGYAQQYSDNWRQDALEMIEDGKPYAAKLILDEAERRANYSSDPLERINNGRFLGEAFYKLGSKERSDEQFEKAMQAALKIKPTWRSLSAVISVLELQAETEDKTLAQDLIQKSLDAKLLPNMAKDRYASEIGRYVKRFEMADRNQIFQLLNQLRMINEDTIRKKALFAMSELTFAPYEENRDDGTLTLPLGMDDFERFFWFSNVAKYFEQSGKKYHFVEAKNAMQKAYDRLTDEQKSKHRTLYRSVIKMDYAPVKQTQSDEPSAKDSDGEDLLLTQPSSSVDIDAQINAPVEMDDDFSIDDKAKQSPNALEKIFYGK